MFEIEAKDRDHRVNVDRRKGQDDRRSGADRRVTAEVSIAEKQVKPHPYVPSVGMGDPNEQHDLDDRKRMKEEKEGFSTGDPRHPNFSGFDWRIKR